METKDNRQNQAVSGQKKRVLFVITQSDLGGAQRFLVSLLSRLNLSNYDVSVAIGAEGADGITPSLREKNISVLKMTHLVRNVDPISDLKALKEFKKLLLSNNPEVLFLLSSKAGFIGSLAVKQLKLPIKVIYRIGGWTFNDPWPFWKKKIFLWMEKMSAGWKDIIIVNNEYDFELADKNDIKPRGQIEVIYNGLDVYKLDFLTREEARHKLACKTKTVIGTIANFYPAKGLEYLIETAAYLKDMVDVSFVVIGGGLLAKDLKNKIQNLKLENKVFLVGQLADAYRYLPAFDVFVLSSVKEGFPWAVIEAMAAKLPVVATSVGAVPEIIQNGKNGIVVPPREPKIMANAIKTILESPKMAQELGIQAHQRVLFKYSLDKMVSQIEALL